MCFSAAASFGASAFLVGAGIYAIKSTESPNKLAFASTPILFGVQQMSEGMLWLSFHDPDFAYWNTASIYAFLLIAQVIWPIWVPFTIWLMEPDKGRKKVIFCFMPVGVVFAAAVCYYLFADDVSAVIEDRHIRYHFYFPSLGLRRSAYFLVTLVPIFLSSLRLMKLLGVAFLASLIFSCIFFSQYVISVWCFFAAVLSVLVLFVIAYNKRSISRSSLT